MKITVKFLILLFITTLLFVLAGNRIFISRGRKIKYFVYAALIIYFVFRTKLIKIIFDRSYQGTVVDINIKGTTELGNDYYPNLIAFDKTWFPNLLYRKNIYYASIAMDNGKEKRKNYMPYQ